MSARSASVVVVGSLNADHVLDVERRPRAGETVTNGVLRTYPGGKGANQAVAAARAGACVSMIGKIGRDAIGEQQLRGLRQNGVETETVLFTEEAATGYAAILVTPDGQNSIAVAAGANQLLQPDDLQRVADVISGATVLVMQLELNQETIERAAELADPSTLLIVNCAPYRPLSPRLLSRIDVLVANEHEAGEMIGSSIVTLSDAAGAVCEIAERGPTHVVLTLGEQGAVFGSSCGSEHVIAPTVHAVDTTGAGDAFVGVVAARLASGDTVEDAIRAGVLAGTATTTTKGPSPQIPAELRGSRRESTKESQGR